MRLKIVREMQAFPERVVKIFQTETEARDSEDEERRSAEHTQGRLQSSAAQGLLPQIKQ